MLMNNAVTIVLAQYRGQLREFYSKGGVEYERVLLDIQPHSGL